MRKVVCLTLVAWSLAGCSGTAPYIHQSEEFNRSRPDFGRPLKDRTELTICYNKRSSSPQEIKQMALDECGRFNRTPVFVDQDFATCPLLTPTAINFRCAAQTGARR